MIRLTPEQIAEIKERLANSDDGRYKCGFYPDIDALLRDREEMERELLKVNQRITHKKGFSKYIFIGGNSKCLRAIKECNILFEKVAALEREIAELKAGRK